MSESKRGEKEIEWDISLERKRTRTYRTSNTCDWKVQEQMELEEFLSILIKKLSVFEKSFSKQLKLLFIDMQFWNKEQLIYLF